MYVLPASGSTAGDISRCRDTDGGMRPSRIHFQIERGGCEDDARASEVMPVSATADLDCAHRFDACTGSLSMRDRYADFGAASRNADESKAGDSRCAISRSSRPLTFCHPMCDQLLRPQWSNSASCHSAA